MIHLIYSSNNNWFEIKIFIFVLEELFSYSLIARTLDLVVTMLVYFFAKITSFNHLLLSLPFFSP